MMSYTVQTKTVPADYAATAVLAKAVSAEMLMRLDWVTLQPKVIVDMGCGMGHCVSALQKRYPAADIIAVDAIYPKLQHMQRQEISVELNDSNTKLPLADHSVDLIFANFVLPWCDNIDALLQEWRRILRPEGLLVFAGLGPDTLQAWHSLLGDSMLPNLLDMHHYGDALTKARFADPVLDVEYFTLRYRDLKKLFMELQATGMLSQASVSKTLGEKSMALCSEAGLWSTVYEVIHGHAWGPAATVDQIADEFGVVKIPLAHLRRR